MKYDFDRELNREKTQSLKWEFLQTGPDLLHRKNTNECFGENRILPMWVADMDFPCPEPVVTALMERAKHGIYGYTAPTDPFYLSVVNWMKKRHGWSISPEWICITPGVVPALHLLVRTFISPGENVLVQTPVYYPFFSAIKNNSGEITANPLRYDQNRYRMDVTDLEKKVNNPKVKMAILCSPHNPVGRVWTKDELSHFGEICMKRNLVVVSDEIHGDLIYRGSVFTPFADINDDFAQHAVVCTAPSKTFNLAGLHTSCIIIPNDDLRFRFKRTLQSNGLSGINPFGAAALQAAYDHGEEWLDQVLGYIEGNRDFLEEYIRTRIPKITVVHPEGTYLVWLDCRRLELDRLGLRDLMLNQARIHLDDGFIFGADGEGFVRINIACPKSILADALDRIRLATMNRTGN